MVLHIGAMNDWDIDHLDIKMAFLHGELDKEIYMEQPEGTKEPGREDWICCLNKSLYGLYQASQQWLKKLYDCLTKEGSAVLQNTAYSPTQTHWGQSSSLFIWMTCQ